MARQGEAIMATRPSADDLKRYWGLAEMQTERVWFRQTYIDPKAGPEGTEERSPSAGCSLGRLSVRVEGPLRTSS